MCECHGGYAGWNCSVCAREGGCEEGGGRGREEEERSHSGLVRVVSASDALCSLALTWWTEQECVCQSKGAPGESDFARRDNGTPPGQGGETGPSAVSRSSGRKRAGREGATRGKRQF